MSPTAKTIYALDVRKGERASTIHVGSVSHAWFFAGLLAFLLPTHSGHAQFTFSDAQTGPSMVAPIPQLRYLETDVEVERNTYNSSHGIGGQDSTRYYVSPRIGISWNYFIYHPYLLSWSALLEPGYVWQHQTFGHQSNGSEEFIVDGSATVNLLEAKPYATTFSYNRSHQEVKYDFFNTAQVDSEGWGATTGYHEGPVPVTASFQQTREDNTDFNQRATTEQTTVNFDARNERSKQNATDLVYQYNQFGRETFFSTESFHTENTYNHVALTDMECFEKSNLRTMLRFDDRRNDFASSTDLNASLDYHRDLTAALRGYANFAFSRYTAADSDSIQNYAITGIQHQLYESLASGLELHGSTLDTTSGNATFASLSVGSTVSADYSKHIGSWGRLTIDNSTSFNSTDQQTSGSELLIPNESYTVPANGLIRLTQPRVVAIAGITDTNNLPLQQGLDFTVVQTTDPWQIQIITGGPSHISAGSIILVTYTVEPNPSGHYTVFANQSQIRLSFWGERAAIYARYNFSENHASSKEFLLQDENLFQSGVEFVWHGLRANADYINQHSTLYDSTSFNLMESYSLNLSPQSSFGLDFNQQWAHNSFHSGSAQETEDLTYYNFMLHYEWRPTTSLNCNFEVGYLRQRGLLDEDLFAARAYLNWAVGKLQMRLGYEHGYQDIHGEIRDRDFAFLRVKRMF